MTPADYVLAFLSKGPATRLALVGMLMGHGYKPEPAEQEVGQAILALTRVGKIESFARDCFRLTVNAAQMEKADAP